MSTIQMIKEDLGKPISRQDKKYRNNFGLILTFEHGSIRVVDRKGFLKLVKANGTASRYTNNNMVTNTLIATCLDLTKGL